MHALSSFKLFCYKDKKVLPADTAERGIQATRAEKRTCNKIKFGKSPKDVMVVRNKTNNTKFQI